MAKGKEGGGRKGSVQVYRHAEEKRKNNPPAKIAAEGTVPAIPKATYHYSPRRPPELRFDPTGDPDKLPELLEKAQREVLTADEAKLLAEAVRNHQPWLEWADKQEQQARGHFEVDPVALHIHERIAALAILKVVRLQARQREARTTAETRYHDAVQLDRLRVKRAVPAACDALRPPCQEIRPARGRPVRVTHRLKMGTGDMSFCGAGVSGRSGELRIGYGDASEAGLA